ncbi:class I SAM-dependent methyltransferase [Microcoleus sp. herbarium12]|uniref:class I SAM-dependent methyltransferase n=1 Tax=Microcoleus sp. herbarium12 TaxID=3055437 RepID=UPI002FCEBAE1
MQHYTKELYQYLQKTCHESAKEIIPILWEYVQQNRVIDVGCGTGTWLSAFQEYGVQEILGIDGDWVDPKMLEIWATNFSTFDLTQPLRLEKQFDLVVSLEVAEHLPLPACPVICRVFSQAGSGDFILSRSTISRRNKSH